MNDLPTLCIRTICFKLAFLLPLTIQSTLKSTTYKLVPLTNPWPLWCLTGKPTSTIGAMRNLSCKAMESCCSAIASEHPWARRALSETMATTNAARHRYWYLGVCIAMLSSLRKTNKQIQMEFPRVWKTQRSLMRIRPTE